MTDQHKKPVEHALLYLVRISNTGPGPRPKAEAMNQRDFDFNPYILIVNSGSPVKFPNWDSSKHHVFSFFGVQRVELELYKGTPPPIVFDKPGWVPLACKIHDWMRGHIYVLDTPHSALTTSKGEWKIQKVPAGEYDLFVWHPLLAGTWAELKPRLDELKRRIVITSQPAQAEHFELKLQEDKRPARPKDVDKYEKEKAGN